MKLPPKYKNHLLTATWVVIAAAVWSLGAAADPVERSPKPDDLPSTPAIHWEDERSAEETYSTPPESAIVPPTGWARLGELQYTTLPLLDARTDLFARLSYRDALESARLLGARLPTVDELERIWLEGFRITPCPLVKDEADLSRMRSIAYARKHDRCVWKQLDSQGWDQKLPVANAGKWWTAGAPAGRAWLYGWWYPQHDGSTLIVQNRPQGPGPHDDQYRDYGSLTYLVRDER
jgi:hypothetical protein